MVAPVAFGELREQVDVDATVDKRIDELVAFKRQGEEASSMDRDEVLHLFIANELGQLDARNAEMESRRVDVAVVDTFFQQVLADDD